MAAKKNERYPLRIQGYGSAGEGVARLEGQAVFVKGALRGELCQVHLLKVGKTAAWGKVDQVLEPSPGRQVPDCPRYPQCGGCQLRHMTYAEELAFKRQKVQDALQRIGGWEGEVTGIHGAKDPDRYRNKIQFPVAEGPKVGFFRARSHDVIDAPDCLLQPMAATRLRGAFRDWMAAHRIPAYDEKAHRGLLRHFYVRTNRKGQSLCAVIANGEALPQEAALVQALRQAEPNLVGVVLSVNREKTNVILGKTYRTLWGQDYLEDTLCGLEFRLSVPSFYQVNREQAEVLYGRALAFAGLTGRETVVDLYCGIGTITLVMARQAGRAIGAEVIPAAVEDAQANARRNGVENAEFLCADAGQAAQELARRGLRPDVICVDPPRKGISPEVVEAIVQMAPQRVVYVSCDPATLGRDVKRLREGGYLLQQAEAVDLFPRTGHVETVAVLSRKSATKTFIPVTVSPKDMGLDEAKAQPTYENIRKYVKETHGLTVSTLNIAQMKAECGLEMECDRSGGKQQPKCPPEKREAILDAFRHFGMIEDDSSEG